MDFQKVKDHSDLARDPRTGSIVNLNSSEYDQYIARRNARLEEHDKTASIENDLANLKGEINEIKSLLKELVSHG